MCSLKSSIYISLIICIGQYSRATSKDYCNPQLCPKSQDSKHIACNNTLALAKDCGKSASFITITNKRKSLILDLHNSKRNDIALGKIPGFYSAQRMAPLRWDTELEILAKYNVQKCKMEHDKCRNTDRFRHVGQNIGIKKASPALPPIEVNIRHIIDEWFNEYKFSNVTFIASYRKHPDQSKKIGHFTALINDRCISLGCAAIRFESAPERQSTFLMTCNYSSTNFRNRPVYQSGPSGSKCTTGVSTTYGGLCTMQEDIPLNPI